MRNILHFISVLFFVGAVDFSLSRTQLPIAQDSYVLGYEKFHDHAKQTKGQKRVILLGGSSLSWGVSAKELTESMEVLTLNGGLLASIGYRGFFEAAEDVIDKSHDIIVISPEYEMLPNKSGLVFRTPRYCDLFLFQLKKYPIKCIGVSLNRLARFGPVFEKKVAGDYFRSGFNDFGDYVFRRDGVSYAKNPAKNEICDKLDRNISDYVEYHKVKKDEGYQIIYIPNFASQSSCENIATLEYFHKTLHEELGVRGYEEVALTHDDDLFYDSSYHLLSEGVALKTKIFEDHISSYLETTE